MNDKSGRWLVGFALLTVLPATADSKVIEERKLPPTPWIDAGLGGRVTWTAVEEADADIRYIDLHLGEPGVVYGFAGDYHASALAPDGCTAAFIAADDDWRGLMLVHLGPRADNRCPVRLYKTPGLEPGLSWSTDGERVYFSLVEEPDPERIGLFLDSEDIENDPLLRDLDRVGNLYYADAVTGETVPQSLEPGDYRWPCHLAGFGVVCARRAWEEGAPRRLAYTHDAGVTTDLETPGDELVAAPRRYPDDTLLLTVLRDGERWFVRLDPRTAEVVAEAPGPPRVYNPVPDPVDPASGWYLCQTAPAPDPAAELVFVHGLLGEGAVEFLALTDNDHYDGEPSWAVVELEY
ncbi:MAG: hypothetical protein GF399_02335 [Candidatus Coatesbacteria bacterium]|nr:hypothetical protein [Candidatus Coatesbacteria bacterium]